MFTSHNLILKQALVDAAQFDLSDSNRVLFHPVGLEEEGYMSAIVRTTSKPSLTSANSGNNRKLVSKKAAGVLSYLRVGQVKALGYFYLFI